MTWRFRRRIKLFPGCWINFSKNGLSSISYGRPGATVNVPVGRKGPTRGTVGLPGTGLSQTFDLEDPDPGKPSKGMDPAVPTMADVLEMAIQIQRDCWLSNADGPGLGELFWREQPEPEVHGLIGYLKGREDTPREILEATELCCSWDRIELILRRCPDPESISNMCRAIVDAATKIRDYAVGRGWVAE